MTKVKGRLATKAKNVPLTAEWDLFLSPRLSIQTLSSFSLYIKQLSHRVNGFLFDHFYYTVHPLQLALRSIPK